MATTVPQPSLTSTGYTEPAESDILVALQNDMDTAFGTTLDRSLTTPQGQIASSLSAIIAAKNDLFAQYVAQVDPQYSSGRMQDAIAKIYFLMRLPAKPTIATCTCTGLEGTVIPANWLVKGNDGNIYYAVSGTGPSGIPSSGSVDLDWACNTTGPIVCAAGNISKIYSPIPGWSSIYNSAASSGDQIGRDVETQQEFELRRQASVAANSTSQAAAVYAAILASTPAPNDVYVRENKTSASISVGTVTIAPNSLYAAVLGGDSTAIATAIYTKLSGGCGTNGNTTATIIDANYSYPQPEYAISYTTPSASPINIAVALKDNISVPGTITTLVTAAINAAFAGTDGGDKARIGSTTFASRFYSGIASIGSYVQILGIYLSTDSAPSPVLSIDCEIDHYPTVGTITVTLE